MRMIFVVLSVLFACSVQAQTVTCTTNGNVTTCTESQGMPCGVTSDAQIVYC